MFLCFVGTVYPCLISFWTPFLRHSRFPSLCKAGRCFNISCPCLGRSLLLEVFWSLPLSESTSVHCWGCCRWHRHRHSHSCSRSRRRRRRRRSRSWERKIKRIREKVLPGLRWCCHGNRQPIANQREGCTRTCVYPRPSAR